MSNPYYNASGSPATAASLASSPIRAEYTAIQAGFDKMPPLTASTIVGVNAAGTALTNIAATGTGKVVLDTTPNLTGPVGVGMVPTNILDITQNQNATSKASLLNNNGGSGALSTFVADNGTHTTNVYQLGEGYVGTGVLAAGYGGIAAGSGLFFNAGAGKPILFGIGAGPGTEAGRFDTGGKFLINATAAVGAEKLRVNGSTYTDGNATINGIAAVHTTLGGWTSNAIFEALAGGGSALSGYNLGAGDALLLRVDSTSTNFARFNYANSAYVGSITTNGTTTSYNTSSDQRLKDNIVDAGDAGSIIDALRVRQWDWKSNGSHEAFGFVAQEEIATAPFAVTAGDADPNTITRQWQRDDSKLVPLLVKEIQSLRARVAALEAK